MTDQSLTSRNFGHLLSRDSEEDDESGEELGGPNRFIDDEASEEGSEAGDEDDLSDSE